MFEKQQMSEREKGKHSSTLKGLLFITISEVTVILQLGISIDLH